MSPGCDVLMARYGRIAKKSEKLDIIMKILLIFSNLVQVRCVCLTSRALDIFICANVNRQRETGQDSSVTCCVNYVSPSPGSYLCSGWIFAALPLANSKPLPEFRSHRFSYQGEQMTLNTYR